jgi:hypothetical protein
MIRAFLLNILLISVFFTTDVYAYQQVKLQVTAQKNSIRVLFISNKPIEFKIDNKDNIVNVSFKKPIKIKYDQPQSEIQKYFSSIEPASNDESLTIKLAKPSIYKIRKFLGDDFVGFEIIDKNGNDSAPNKIALPSTTIKENKNNQVLSPNQVIKNIEPEAKGINIQVKKDFDTNFKEWIFPWRKNVAAASFYRAGYLWVIFSDYEEVNAEQVIEAYKNDMRFEQIPNNAYTILRFKGKRLSNAQMFKVNNNWILAVGERPNPKYVPKSPITEYKSPHSRGVFFPAENIAKPITIIDPEIGDQLIVVGFEEPGYGVPDDRNFIDFKVLESSQGFVVNPISDKVTVEIVKPGIEVLVPKKNISEVTTDTKTPEIDKKELELQNRLLLQSGLNNNKVDTIFPFKEWAKVTDANYMENRKFLQQRIINDYERHFEHLFNFGRFLFATKHLPESNAIFGVIKNYDKIFFKMDEVKLLNGAAYYLRDRYLHAKQEFEDVNLNNLPPKYYAEINFWKNANEFKITKNENVNFSYLDAKHSFLRSYPDWLQHHFALLEIEKALLKRDYDRVTSILNIVSEEEPQGQIKNSFAYYRGLIAAKRGNTEQASDIWEQLQRNILDRYNRARAGFALVDLQLANKKITEDEAIKKLNSLRNVWRGDDNEMELLKYLAELHYNKKNYIDALRVWRQLLSNLPNNINGLTLTSRMSKVFIELFSNPLLLKGMSDFDACSLYYEFRELTPIGAEGDKITQSFAYKLVKLDLLDRAAALLEHQIKYRIQGYEKYQLINKLAAVYLMNKKPAKAHELLENSSEEVIPASLMPERKLLRVQALVDSENYASALYELDRDASKQADDLRVMILWRAKEWRKLEGILLKRIDEISKNLPGQLSDEQIDNLVRLSICYTMLNQKEEAKDLAKKFAGLMSSNPKAKDTIQFLADSQEPINYSDLENTVGIKSFQDFLDKTREDIIKDGVKL